ncbi:putative membrane protein [Bacilli bacterium PM5-3]|nr:putative membrane protein [Bacilli bacterium PM5-3]
MNKNEYISRLASGIAKYDVSNKYDILADYEQIVDEILVDNDNDFNAVIEKLGYPEILAMEIMDELGYTDQQSKRNDRYKNSNEDITNKFGTKRQRSNIIWNIILFFYYIVQVGLSLALVIMIGFTIYFGLNSSASINHSVKNNDVITTLTICRETNCNSYISTYKDNSNHIEKNEFSIKKCEDKKCKIYNDITNSASVPIGFIFAMVDIILIVILWLSYIIVYKNVRSVIKRNNEYNRRRSYE